jgi:sulfite reductase (ferredoxin)
MGLAASEREVFEAQVLLDEKKIDEAAQRAVNAMMTAAQALTRELNPNLGDDREEIVSEFRTRLHDTKIFHDPFAGPKFAHYLFKNLEQGSTGLDEELVHQRIEEAQLFVEAAYACYQRMSQTQTAAE